MEYANGEKYCKGCGKNRPVTAFEFNNKAKTVLNASCIACRRAPKKLSFQTHYKNNRQAYIDKKKERRAAITAFIRQYKTEHPRCSDCKLPHAYWRLDFDHLRDKHQIISSASAYGWSINRVLEEIAKCELVCANCHRDRTQARLTGG